MEMHFHSAIPPAQGRWACGASIGQASGDVAQVDCPACMATDAYQDEVQEVKRREEEHAALMKPPSPAKEDSDHADDEVLSVRPTDMQDEGERSVHEHDADVPAMRSHR